MRSPGSATSLLSTATGARCCRCSPRSSFVFVDGGGPETKTDPRVIDLGTRGTIFVLDDLTPGYSGPDPVRDLWLGSERLAGVEILTTSTTAAIVATLL